MSSFAVIGATSWGTTLAALLAANGHAVSLVCRSADEAAAVSALRGIARLPEVRLPAGVTAVPPGGAGSVAGLVAAVPAQALRAALRDPSLPRGTPLLVAAKGLELETRKLLPAVAADCGWSAGAVGVLSGPNLAHEVARGLPAATVVACAPGGAAGMWQSALNGERFRVYTSTDVTGVALGGSLKNVVAIAAGAAVALEYGTNAVATLLTRGLAEITRLGVALGADPLTFQGLAGLGDLAATCFSPLSRNHRFGALLALGRPVAEARREIGEAVEGVATAPVAVALAAEHGLEMPIAAAVAAVIAGDMTVPQATRGLLTRPPTAEAGRPG